MTSDEITREEAKQLVDEADRGILTVVNAEPVPAIGEVDEHELEVTTEMYSFGGEADE